MYRNKEGYSDPTAEMALKRIDEEKRAKDLIFILRYIIGHSGFELIERIKLRDKKSGREFK